MPSFDISFKNVRFLAAPSAQVIEVVVGEEFIIDLKDYTGEHKWATFYDKLLELDEKPYSVKAKALAVGDTEIQVQAPSRNTPAYIVVKIVESFPEPANELGGTVTVRPRT